MTQTEFIHGLIDHGLELLANAKVDPRRTTFIDAVVTHGLEILGARQYHLDVFEEEFINAPHRFRWELLGKTVLEKKKLTSSQARELDVLGIEPDLLAPLRRLRKETSHTRALAWALSPSNRWLGPAALEAFLKRVDALRADLKERDDEADIAALWTLEELASGVVRAEHHFSGYGRADLSISLPRALLLVEVKIDAEQRPDQIRDYMAAAVAQVRDTARTPLVVYLTLDPEADPGPATAHLTFEQLLRDWLPIVAANTSPEHSYLGAYLASVARIVGVGDAGTFDDWDFAQRRRAIEFIKTREIE